MTPPGSRTASPAAPSPTRRPSGRAQLDDPLAAATGGPRDVQHDRTPVGAVPVERGGLGVGVVDDEEVAPAQHAREPGEREVSQRASRARDQQPHPVPRHPTSLGRGGGRQLGRHGERSAVDAGLIAGTTRVGGAVAAGRGPLVDQPEERRDDGLGFGPVGDVLARERPLVHGGAHVAGVERVDGQVGLLDAEHGRVVVERGLGGAVAAPARVGLDGGVGAERHHGAAGGAQRGQRELGELQRGEQGGLEDGAQRVGRVGRRAAAAGEGPSSPALCTSRSMPLARGGDQRGARGRVVHVAGHRAHAGQVGDGGPQPRRVAGAAITATPRSASAAGEGESEARFRRR